jgi:hypothetical protein
VSSPPDPSGDRPPQRCAQEFQISGSSSFVSRIWAHLNYIYDISPSDYNMIMTCAGSYTRIRRIVQSGSNYSDMSGTIQLTGGDGPLGASMLVHEAAHIILYGWNASGSYNCTPENNTLEHQARFLDRAGLHETAGWYRGLKNEWNCPAP